MVASTFFGSDNGLSPNCFLAFIGTNAGLPLIRTLGTKYRKIFIEAPTTFVPEGAFKNVIRNMAAT